MRKFVQNFLPHTMVKYVGSMLLKQRNARLSRLTPAEAFDEIYRRKMWRQGVSLSGLGSEGKWADDYVRFVSAYIREHKCKSILDIGCGDFSIGLRLYGIVDEYYAVDVSREIININKIKYFDLKNVIFKTLNVLSDKMPDCDLVLVRQVFQHLSNSQIESALTNIHRNKPRHLLITEQTLRPEEISRINYDLKSHSVTTRIAQKSCVDIGAPPFNRPRRIAAMFEPGPENGAEPNSVLCIYELQSVE